MNRLRPQSRIRPIRPYWPRSRILTALAAAAVIVALAGTAWLQRTEDREVALDAAGPVAFRSDAGPVEVRQGGHRSLRYRASWLLVGPDDAVSTTPLTVDVALRCDTVLPCRAPAELELVAGDEATVDAVDDVSVTRFDGPLDLRATGGGSIIAGPIAGPLRAVTERGDVVGHGLRSPEVEVETAGGRVELRFAARPRRVEVLAGGEPVTIELPDGAYAVSVRSGSSVAIEVERSPTADSEIVVQARGPVRIRPAR